MILNEELLFLIKHLNIELLSRDQKYKKMDIILMDGLDQKKCLLKIQD